MRKLEDFFIHKAVALEKRYNSYGIWYAVSVGLYELDILTVHVHIAAPRSDTLTTPRPVSIPEKFAVNRAKN